LNFEHITGDFWVDRDEDVGPETKSAFPKGHYARPVHSGDSTDEGSDAGGEVEGQGPCQLQQGTRESRRAFKKWPTDDDEFEEKTAHASERVRNVLQQAIGMATVIWGSMFVWALSHIWHHEMNDKAGETPVSFASARNVPVQWPNSLFRPHVMACAAGWVFLADKLQIYKLPVSGGRMERVPCSLRSTITSLGAVCDNGWSNSNVSNATSCRPIVLAHEAPGDWAAPPRTHVVDCATGEAWPLLREAQLAQHLGVAIVDAVEATADEDAEQHKGVTKWKGISLLASHGNEVIRYDKGDSGWEPQWHITPPGGPDLRALGVASDRVLLFYQRAAGDDVSPEQVGRSSASADAAASTLATGTVVARDVRSMAWRGTWQLPRGAKRDFPRILGGCALQDGGALVLPQSMVLPDNPPPRVVRLSLP